MHPTTTTAPSLGALVCARSNTHTYRKLAQLVLPLSLSRSLPLSMSCDRPRSLSLPLSLFGTHKSLWGFFRYNKQVDKQQGREGKMEGKEREGEHCQRQRKSAQLIQLN